MRVQIKMNAEVPGITDIKHTLHEVIAGYAKIRDAIIQITLEENRIQIIVTFKMSIGRNANLNILTKT